MPRAYPIYAPIAGTGALFLGPRDYLCPSHCDDVSIENDSDGDNMLLVRIEPQTMRSTG